MGRISYNKRPGLLEPDSTFVKLRYVQDLQASVFTTGSTNVYDAFIGNSIYRPDETAGSLVNANGLLYYKQAYTNYVVLGSKCRVTACNNSTTAPRMFYLLPTTDVISSTSALQIIQSQPYVKRTMLGVASGAGNTKTLSSYMSTRKIFGKPGTTVSADLSGTGATSPAKLWNWFIFFHQNSTDTTGPVWYNVEITFYVKFYGRQTLSGY